MTTTTDMDAIKARMKATWMAGDYGTFATYMAPGALEILKGWRLEPGTTLLDVGCGAGQIAIPAARAGLRVTGIDIATNSLAQARARAEAEGVQAQFDEGDAEALPYPDATFDTVVSLVGAMFAPRPARVAAEFIRVTRSGGRILMVNWTPNGFVGAMFRTLARYVPPLPGVPPAALWGDEATVRERLGEGVSSLKLTRHDYPSFTYPFAVPEVVAFFRKHYGPMQRAFAGLETGAQDALQTDLEGVFATFNRAEDGTTRLEAEYLEVDALRS